MKGAVPLAVVILSFACGARTGLAGGVPDAACHEQTTAMQVPAASPWFDTGIDVVAGTEVVIHASGTVRYGGDPAQTAGADGGNYVDPQFFSNAIYPKVVIHALIAKVGGSAAVGTGTPVPQGAQSQGAGFVGADYDGVMTTSGRLFLGYNDSEGYFDDNAGAFDVTLTTHDPC